MDLSEGKVDFLDALLCNDVYSLDGILSKVNSKDKLSFLNDSYEFNNLTGEPEKLPPFSIAVLIGALEVVKFLLEQEVSILCIDGEGNNIFHLLIHQAFEHPEINNNILMRFRYLLHLLKKDDIKSLLLMENQTGIRPLECAAQHGLHEIFSLIINTDVYLISEKQQGLTTYKHYDITEYEDLALANNRCHYSPLILVAFADKKVVKKTKKFLGQDKEFIEKWGITKFWQNVPMIALLFVFRMVHITGFYIFDLDTSYYDTFHTSNISYCRPDFAIVMSSSAKRSLGIYLIVHSAIILCLYIIYAIRFQKDDRKVWRATHKSTKKETVVQSNIYEVTEILYSSFVIVFVSLAFVSNKNEAVLRVLNLMRMICPSLSVWNILYFVQLFPSIGHFVIAINIILIDMLHFVLIYALMFIPFIHIFSHIVNYSTNVGCIEGFGSFFETLYTLLTVSLNMLDFTTFDIRDKPILYFAHIMFTFVISIMMLNFFIALMSSSVSQLSTIQRTAIWRQRVATSVHIESRFAWINPKLWVKLSKFERVENRVVISVKVFKNTCE